VSADTTRPSIALIQRVVATHHGLDPAVMTARTRGPERVALARQIAMALALQEAGQSSGAVGRKFGGRDHTTVLHARAKVRKLRAESAPFSAGVERIERDITMACEAKEPDMTAPASSPYSWPAGASVLHLYAQDGPHDPAAIVGTRAALTTLRDAITAALDTGQPAPANTMTDDGEGYSAVVVPVEEDKANGLPLPYGDWHFKDGPLPDWLQAAVMRAAAAVKPTP
jgi:hypothetical protein